MTIQSRDNNKKQNRASQSNGRTVNAKSISTKRFEGTGNIASYVKSVVVDPAFAPNLSDPENSRSKSGRFVSNRVTPDRQTLTYLTERANRFYDQTGAVPSPATIGSWF